MQTPWLPAPLRVLVADDNRDTLQMLMLLLRDEGYEVRGAYTGTDVMRIARLNRFDVIILDIEMPEMSGYAIAQDLRTHYYGSRAPLPVSLANEPFVHTRAAASRTRLLPSDFAWRSVRFSGGFSSSGRKGAWCPCREGVAIRRRSICPCSKP